jgi:hypothetical protein
LIFIHEAILRLHVATQRKDSSSSSQSSTSETSNSRPSSQKNTENSFTNRHPDAERYTFRTGFTSPNFSRNETEWQKEYSQYSHFYRTHFDELRREMEEDESEPFDYFVRRSPNVYRRQSEYQNVHTIWERAVFGDKFVELSNKHEYPPVFECLEYYLDSYHNSGHLFDIFLHKRPLNQLYIVDQGNTIFRFRTGISGTPLQAVKEQSFYDNEKTLLRLHFLRRSSCADIFFSFFKQTVSKLRMQTVFLLTFILSHSKDEDFYEAIESLTAPIKTLSSLDWNTMTG